MAVTDSVLVPAIVAAAATALLLLTSQPNAVRAQEQPPDDFDFGRPRQQDNDGFGRPRPNDPNPFRNRDFGAADTGRFDIDEDGFRRQQGQGGGQGGQFGGGGGGSDNNNVGFGRSTEDPFRSGGGSGGFGQQPGRNDDDGDLFNRPGDREEPEQVEFTERVQTPQKDEKHQQNYKQCSRSSNNKTKINYSSN